MNTLGNVTAILALNTSQSKQTKVLAVKSPQLRIRKVNNEKQVQIDPQEAE